MFGPPAAYVKSEVWRAVALQSSHLERIAIGRVRKIRLHFNQVVFRRCKDTLAQNRDMAGAKDHQNAVAGSAGHSLEISEDAQIAVIPGGDPIDAWVGMTGADLEPPGQVRSVAFMQRLLGIVAQQRFADGVGETVTLSMFECLGEALGPCRDQGCLAMLLGVAREIARLRTAADS